MDFYYRDGQASHWALLAETVKDCRGEFGRLIGAEAAEIALVGSTSEGLNIVANMLDFKPGENVVVTDVEFPTNLFPWLNLTRKGVQVRTARVLGKENPLEEIAKEVNERTRVLAVSSVAFANGLFLDLGAAAELAHSQGAYLVVDAAQSIGVIPLDVHKAGIDFLACSGFKWLMSPIGTGALFVRKELVTRFSPAYVSWYSVENPFNFVPGNPMRLTQDASRFTISGNINMLGFQGFRAALRFLHEVGVEKIRFCDFMLRDRILDRVAELGLPLISPADRSRLGPMVNFRVSDPDGLVKKLRQENIHAVQRIGGLRLSPHIYNTVEEIDNVMALVAEHARANPLGCTD